MIVLRVLGVKSYHMLYSLWVMCLVFGFLSGVYRFAGRTEEKESHSSSNRSCDNQKDICKLTPLLK